MKCVLGFVQVIVIWMNYEKNPRYGTTLYKSRNHTNLMWLHLNIHDEMQTLLFAHAIKKWKNTQLSHTSNVLWGDMCPLHIGKLCLFSKRIQSIKQIMIFNWLNPYLYSAKFKKIWDHFSTYPQFLPELISILLDPIQVRHGWISCLSDFHDECLGGRWVSLSCCILEPSINRSMLMLNNMNFFIFDALFRWSIQNISHKASAIHFHWIPEWNSILTAKWQTSSKTDSNFAMPLPSLPYFFQKSFLLSK